MDAITDITEPETEQKTIKLAEFLDEWGDILKAEVVKNMNPVYSPKAEDDWDLQAREKLQQLLRKPFESQTRKGILPVARSFFKEDQKADFLVGEMGPARPSWVWLWRICCPRPISVS